MMERHKKVKWSKAVFFVLVWTVIVIYVLPILWIVTTSFKTDAEAYALPIKWIGFEWTTVNYQNVFQKGSMIHNFWNSVFVAVLSSLLSLLIGVPAAYALSRYRMERGDDLQLDLEHAHGAAHPLCGPLLYLVKICGGL